MKLSINLLICLLGINTALAATDSSLFRYQAPLSGAVPADGTLAKVTLTAEVIRNSNNRYGDLRIFDNNNREVPYVLQPEIIPGEEIRQTELEVIKYDDSADNSVRITLKCPDHWTSTEKLTFNTADLNFEKDVKIETSNDNSHWQDWATGSIYDYSSRVKLHNYDIAIPATKARYLRLTITDSKPAKTADGEKVNLQYKDLSFRIEGTNKGAFHIDAIDAFAGKSEQDKIVLDSTPLTIANQSVDSTGNTVIVITDCKIPLSSIEFNVATKYFYRELFIEYNLDKNLRKDRWASLTSGSIARLPATSEAKVTVPMTGNAYPNLRITISNGDDTPLSINGIKGYYQRQNLYFTPEAGKSYRLVFGSSRTHAPVYDMQSLLSDSAETANAVPWKIDTTLANQDFKKNFFADGEEGGMQTRLFQGIILVMVVGLGFWAWSALKKTKAPTA